ncbi:MAG: cell division protein FtsA [Bacteroidia bacterium]|nr:cell division protein FtsA [Bacteroidia bacterium]
MSQTRELAAAIDIGTSHTRAILGRFTSDNKLDVLAFSEVVTQGVRNGVVVNIDDAADSIRKAVSVLERATNLKVKKLYAGISGQKIGNRPYQGIVKGMSDEARRHAVQPGEKIYHLVPTEYMVDGEREINKPVGIAGRRIDATFNIILASDNYEKNLTRAIEKAGFELALVFINPFVQGTACLSQDEKEAGVVLLDMGAGTTGISLYYENKLRLALELPFGGNVISNDIKEGCNIIPRHAEMVKVNCGFAMTELAPENKVAQIPEVEGWPGKEISFKSLAGIIQARVEEIMEWVNFQLESSGYVDKLGAGIVLTGKGAGLNGLDKVVSYMTGLDVRYGKPIVAMKEQLFNEQLATPASANLLGILIHGLINSRNLKYPAGMVDPIVQEEAPKAEPVKRKTRGFSDLVGKFKDGFDNLFEEPDHK